MLVAVLIGPFLIDWNGFRATFEARASEILGQPVRILGEVDLRTLPSPTITIENLEVGDTEGTPMATVERISLRLELLPLLTGQFNVTELILDRPVVTATVDDTGTLDWVMRPETPVALDPDSVALERIVVNDGSLTFFDARTGGAFTLTQINTNVFEASSLNGPWRIDGSLVCRADLVCGDALPVTFSLSTGRVAVDGTMRVNAEATPASAALAGTLRTEGVVSREEGLIAYDGTFRFDKLALTAAPGSPAATGLASAWTIAGGFRLEAERLTLSAFTWESSDGLFAVNGDASLTLGENAVFDATLVSRQIDLDNAFGDGAAVAIDDAATAVWERLAAIAVPTVPGRVSLTIPSMIVSGSLLQNVTVAARAEDGHWVVESFELLLPGQSRLGLAGRFDPGAAPAFVGGLEFETAQPAAFADWWRNAEPAGVAIAPFSLSAAIEIGPERIFIGAAELRSGGELLRGAVTWTAGNAEQPRSVTADLATDAFDLDQLRAIADLFVADAEAGAPTSYSLNLAADTLRAGAVAIGDVAIDAVLTQDALAINALRIGDLDGAVLTAAGTLTDLAAGTPRGTITATLDAERLDGVVALVRHILGDGAATAWLTRASPHLTPLHIEATVSTQTAAGFAYQIAATGTAAGTTLRVAIDANGDAENWAERELAVEVEIDAADGAQLVRQAGLAAGTAPPEGEATVDFAATGIPATGLDAHLQATLAGVLIASDGTLTWDGAGDAMFAGPVTMRGDLDPLARLFGLALPNAGEPTPAVVEADVAIAGRAIELNLRTDSSIAQRSLSGLLALAEENGAWRLTGALALEEVDVGWLAAWPLGYDPLPAAGEAEPWSRQAFAGGLVPGLVVDLNIAADSLRVGEGLTIANADLGFTFDPSAARLELRNGQLSTGLVRSTVSLAFQDGQIVLDGQLFLADVPLDVVVWRSEVQPVADGIVALSAEFRAIGRSPAGLISTLNGSGSLEISRGVFYFMGADAFDQVIRLADEGDTMTEERLREAFTGFLDNGTLAFGDATIPFSIAGGIITPSPIIQEVGAVRVVARAPIDLNRLTIDSSWELTLVQGRGLVDGLQPRAFVNFTGPLAEPVRQVNVAPLVGYLSVRRLRETEQLQAEVLERERFIRIMERVIDDRALAPAPVEPPPEEVPAPAAGTPELLLPPLAIPGP